MNLMVNVVRVSNTFSSFIFCENFLFTGNFYWRKDLNYGNGGAKNVPPDTFYAYGGGGQFAVIIPSLDMLIVSFYGGVSARFIPPLDLSEYLDSRFFPTTSDSLITDSFCDGGFDGWGCVR